MKHLHKYDDQYYITLKEIVRQYAVCPKLFQKHYGKPDKRVRLTHKKGKAATDLYNIDATNNIVSSISFKQAMKYLMKYDTTFVKRTQLINEFGWTNRLIDLYYPRHDKTEVNPRSPHFKRIQYRSRARVCEIMMDPVFQSDMQRTIEFSRLHEARTEDTYPGPNKKRLMRTYEEVGVSPESAAILRSLPKSWKFV